jgi:hypothetical protein
VDLQDLVYGAVDVVFAGCFGEEDVDGECTAGDVELGGSTVERGETFSVHGCGGDDEFDVSTTSEDFSE